MNKLIITTILILFIGVLGLANNQPELLPQTFQLTSKNISNRVLIPESFITTDNHYLPKYSFVDKEVKTIIIMPNQYDQRIADNLEIINSHSQHYIYYWILFLGMHVTKW